MQTPGLRLCGPVFTSRKHSSCHDAANIPKSSCSSDLLEAPKAGTCLQGDWLTTACCTTSRMSLHAAAYNSTFRATQVLVASQVNQDLPESLRSDFLIMLKSVYRWLYWWSWLSFNARLP